ncbi:DoxX family protein [Nocardioides sp. YIM B13467]|uniref:DoxX family protein n=1 Tax=Nocardioides sp. YIM B13467 TaxID=3366294 RepID=UPI003672C968
MDLGLLILRVLIGSLLVAHAAQKSLGWFSGPGIDGATAIFDKLGQRPARAMVLVAVACESTGGVLVLTGLATPLGAAVCVGTMIVAGASMQRVSGSFWNATGGGEYPYVLAVVSASIGFAGAGSYSLDRVLSSPWYNPSATNAALIGLGVLVAAAVAATPTLLRSRTRTAAESS